MKLDRRIVHMDIKSYGPYTILDDPNTLTQRSASTNDAPRDPLLVTLTLVG